MFRAKFLSTCNELELYPEIPSRRNLYVRSNDGVGTMIQRTWKNGIKNKSRAARLLTCYVTINHTIC
jgi:hypothetical protein